MCNVRSERPEFDFDFIALSSHNRDFSIPSEEKWVRKYLFTHQSYVRAIAQRKVVKIVMEKSVITFWRFVLKLECNYNLNKHS